MLDRVGVKDFDSIGWSKAVASAALDLIPSRRLLFSYLAHPALAEENNCLDGYDYHVHDGQVHLSMEKFTIFKSFRLALVEYLHKALFRHQSSIRNIRTTNKFIDGGGRHWLC